MTDEELAAIKSAWEWNEHRAHLTHPMALSALALTRQNLAKHIPALLAEVERSREIVRAVADGRVTLGYPMPSPGEFVPAGTADWIRQAQALLQRDAGRDEDGQP
jgi:hypothetical protein